MHNLVLIIALGFWIAAFAILWRQIQFHLHANTATGKFIDWVPNRSGNTVTWHPLITFTASDGQTYETQVGFGYYPKPTRPPFSTIAVRYIPDKPEKAQSASWIHYWMGPFIFFAFAITMTAIYVQKLNNA